MLLWLGGCDADKSKSKGDDTSKVAASTAPASSSSAANAGQTAPTGAAAPSSASGPNHFTVSGDDSFTEGNATGSINKMARVDIWKITLQNKGKRADGKRILANLFFSKEFDVKAGTFPVKFSYLGEKDTFGASLFVIGGGPKQYSHDTEGKVTIDAVGKELKGSFEYTTNTRDKKKVTVKGKFAIPPGDLLKK
jgi:hypothetical protein